MADEELTRSLTLLRHQRHNFMNHLQVVSGWLQLGKGERAVGYITRVAARMEAESQALRLIESPVVGLFVVTVGLDAEPYGVALEWKVAGPVEVSVLDEARSRIMLALEQVARLPEGQRRVTVTLGMPIVVHTPSAMGEG